MQKTYSPSTYEEDMREIRKRDKISEDDMHDLAKYILLLAGFQEIT